MDIPNSNEQRKKILIDYIKVNQGCTKEDITKDETMAISRVTIFKLIDELVAEGLVQVERRRPNSRDHKLYVKSDNILVNVRTDLNHVLELIVDLVTAVTGQPQKWDSYTHKQLVPRMEWVVNLTLFRPILLLNLLRSNYQYCSIFSWPTVIKDKGALSNLMKYVLSELTSVYIFIIQNIQYIFQGKYSKHYFEDDIIGLETPQLYGLVDMVAKYQQSGFAKEIEEIMDIIWNIMHIEVLKVLYPEPDLFGWEYHFEEDGWRKLLSIQRAKQFETRKFYEFARVAESMGYTKTGPRKTRYAAKSTSKDK